MTGYDEMNYPAFHAGAQALREAGHEVFNPAETFDGDKSLTWETYMRVDLQAVLDAEGVAVLDGWESSRGATLEVAVARAIGIPVVRFDHDGNFEMLTTR